MDLQTRWRGLDAEYWVRRLCVLHTVLMTVYAVVLAVGSLIVGAPLLGLAMATLPLVSGWLTWAWQEQRPWCWWVLATLAGLRLLLTLGVLLGEGPFWPAVVLAFDAVLLLLLAHPESRARIQPAQAGVESRPHARTAGRRYTTGSSGASRWRERSPAVHDRGGSGTAQEANR